MVQAQKVDPLLALRHRHCLLDTGVLPACQFNKTIARNTQVRNRILPLLDLEIPLDRNPARDRIEQTPARRPRNRVVFKISVLDQVGADPRGKRLIHIPTPIDCPGT